MEQTYSILSATQKLKKLYSHKFRPLKDTFALTQAEIDVLLFLANNPGYDTAKEIANLRSLSKSQVSQAVEKLSLRGFLSAKPDKADRRVAHLEICPSAQEICMRAQAVQRSLIEDLLDGISLPDRALLREMLERILYNAERGIQNVD